MAIESSVVQPVKRNTALESHYIVLMGGAFETPMEGRGENSSGFQTLYRRIAQQVWPIEVGVSVESALGAEALSQPNFEKLHNNWDRDPRRIKTRSALDIVQDLNADLCRARPGCLPQLDWVGVCRR